MEGLEVPLDLEKLSETHGRLYEEADSILQKHRPCQFEDGKCIINRKTSDTESQTNGCCGYRTRPCKHLGPGGCTVKALGCKLHLCPGLSGTVKECAAELHELRKEAYRLLPAGMFHFRNTLFDFTENRRAHHKTQGGGV